MHVSCHIYSTCPSHSPSFLSSIILIISGSMYNLLSYKSCSFLKFPMTLKHKILRTDQYCSPAHSTVFPEYHNPSVTPTFKKILHKHTYTHTHTHTHIHTHMYIFQQSCFQKAERRAKHYQAVVVSINLLHFFSIS
jgi:hypothetical protein